MRKCILLLIVAAFFCCGLEAKSFDEHVLLVPAGDVDEETLKAIRDGMPAFMPMDLKVMIEPPEKLTDAAYDGSSGKYNAKALLTDLTNAITIDLRHESALFVVDVDLYTPESEFVFGLSSPPKRTAIMSLIRLRNEFYGLKPNRYKFLERAVKEAIHQMGHAWGLENCPDVKCVMHHSVNISDMDKYKSRFCTACRKKLYGMYRTPLLKGLPFL